MHHINVKTNVGYRELVLPASDIEIVLVILKVYREAGVEFIHTFID